jgi:glutaryl-CoA dehydrogenase
MYPIYAFGSEEQKQKYLPGMARGEVIGCFGLTEPHGGSDPGQHEDPRQAARLDDWVLNGAKMWITNGAIADIAIVWAMTPEGIRGFLVEKGTPGFSAQKSSTSSRCAPRSPRHCSSTTWWCPPSACYRTAVIGLKGPLSCLTQARYGIAWGVIGAAQACLQQLLEYTQTRRAVRPAAGRRTS